MAEEITLDPEPITLDQPYFAKGKDPSKQVSFQAARHLSHMNPDAPEGPGMIERGLGAVVGTETAARMKEELPGAAAMIAMAAAPELTIPKAATWGPRMYALAKAALGRVAAASLAGGATKGVLASSPSEGGNEAATQAAWGAGGEAVLGAGQAIVAGGKALAPGIVNFARGTTGGRVATKEAADAITEHANATIKKIVDAVSPKAQPEIMGEDAAAMVKKFDLAIQESQEEMAEIPKAAVREAKLGKVDIEPIAKDLKDIVKADEKHGGFMTALTDLETRSSRTTGAARTASKDISELSVEPIEGEAPAETAKRLAAAMKKVLDLRKASLPALMNIRGTVSQIMADEGAPAELRLVAKRIGTGRLDNIIESNLEKIGAGGTWDAYLKNYANAKSIKEAALYRAAKANPQRLHEFIAPQRPDTVATLKAMARQTDMPDIIPTVQRQFLEARLGKGIENFGEEIDGYGPKTVGALFEDPKGREAVNGLKDLSKAIKEKMNAIGAGAESTKEALRLAAVKGALPALGGAYVGERLGEKQGGIVGGVAGGLSGAALGFIAPNQIVKMANNPEKLRRLTTLIRGITPNNPPTPATLNAITQLIRSGVEK